MLKKIIFLVFFSFFISTNTLAISEQNNDVDTPTSVSYQDIVLSNDVNLPVNSTFEIDVSEIGENLRNKIGADALRYEWNIKGRSSKTGSLLSESFETSGTKEITLNIFQLRDNNSTLLISIPISTFIYNEKLDIIIDPRLNSDKVKNFFQTAKENGTLINEVSPSKNSIKSLIENRIKTYDNSKNYITLWGDRKYVFDTLTSINSELKNNVSGKKLDVVIVSDFNRNFLEGYIRNITAENTSLGKILVIDSTSIYQLLGSQSEINILKQKLDDNNYSYYINNEKSDIKPYMFLSQIVSKLSGAGVSPSDLRVILLFPILLILISFMKHFVGLSPIGILLPLFWSILAYHFGAMFIIIIVILLIIINRLLAVFISKYKLLYTPKVTFIFITNYFIFLLGFLILYKYELIPVDPSHLLYIIVFFIMSEKLITTILSKEFGEYKKSLFSTAIIAFLGYIILQSDVISNIIIAYPEFLLLTIPFAFLIGRFTGLRVTEYMRFADIIKSESEE